MDRKEHCSVGKEHISLILFNARGEKYKTLTFFLPEFGRISKKKIQVGSTVMSVCVAEYTVTVQD